MFGITYGYNAYFWDNNIISHIFFSAFCSYLIGIWLISLLLLMSTIFRFNSFVLLAVGGTFLMVYFIGLLPKIGKYMPIQLLNSMDLLLNIEKISGYSYAIIITIILSILNIVASIICFNRKNI
jgi:ABC-2 type transport system permease protein